VYIVNKLDEDIDLSLIVQIDSDFSSDPEYIANRALMLNERGAMAKLDMLRDMKVPDAEGIAARAEVENQMIQLAKEIADKAKTDPRIMEQITALLTTPQESNQSQPA
jgi:hypothetical protein